jgi:hypothetical protein
MKIVGYVDRVQSDKLLGWAALQLDNGQYVRCLLSVFIDGVLHSKILPALYRQDLFDHGIRPGTFGFEFSMPPVLRQEGVSIVYIEGADGTQLAGPPISVIDGIFSSLSLAGTRSNFQKLCRRLTFADIEEKANHVQTNYGDVAMLYYVFGAIVNRSPSKSEVESFAPQNVTVPRAIDFASSL